ncbi:hypothetical protein LTR10_019914 [Elasticomyces elasticus]|uniref:Transcription factor domain-containing protein n=1 Tax=Exophiala sideris TaxID=1016849 RepID=A0ABR0J9S4_9EURO|nr:hypothetical protein LTR10_019914 [Elasticomyces elasticus]KAK5022751.1 hypothetical protein LTS07_009728 [Exophiala sideris]KAK5026653.1 hypothetical protein LTR13_009876 [Exophiala sideris]KAK5059378.1 hypothetical protein LTR69_005966 [Exophiala sideris]KAK5177477.1 hypothetical protein LTR44_010094 [Eurotiomycetes sp. CCFEE 6388]
MMRYKKTSPEVTNDASYIKSLNDHIQGLSSQLALHEHNVEADATTIVSNDPGPPSYILMPRIGHYMHIDRSPASLMAMLAFEALSASDKALDLAEPDDCDSVVPEVSKDRSCLIPSTVRYLLSRYDRCVRLHYDILPRELLRQDGMSLKKLPELERFKVLMACAIAAVRESYRYPTWKTLAHICRDWANESLTPIVLIGDGESLTAILLVLIYELMDPSRGISWELLDLAMRMSLQLGWHRTSQVAEFDHVSSASVGAGDIHDPRSSQVRLMSALKAVEGSLRMIFNRPSMLSESKLPAISNDDTMFQQYMQLSDIIYGTGQVYVTRGCPFMGQLANMMELLENHPTAQHPLIRESWLLFFPLCIKHKQCTVCFQEMDDYTGKGMRTLRHKVVDAASQLVMSLHREMNGKDNFIPPLTACSRAFMSGCTIVTAISKRWTLLQLHVQDLIRCTEVLTLYSPHWRGGPEYLHVWKSLTELLDTA